MDKAFRIPASDIRSIAPGQGACFASDRITVDGELVGYMYRESPEFEADSGWRFFSGSETPEYTDDSRNFGVYDVNTIANYDADIVEHLDAQVGSAFVRDVATGRLRPDTD